MSKVSIVIKRKYFYFIWKSQAISNAFEEFINQCIAKHDLVLVNGNLNGSYKKFLLEGKSEDLAKAQDEIKDWHYKHVKK